MNSETIRVYAFAHFGKDFRESIKDAISNEFRLKVEYKETYLDLSDYYDPKRRQYNGGLLLKVIDNMVPQDSFKVIGLFDVDLFIPILTYIFGQAQLGGRTAIASLYRLRNEQYGIPSERSDILERFIKEVIHELGHTFGLPHCHTPTCVMRSSTYVEDIDQKERYLCHKCRKSGFLDHYSPE